MPVDRYMQICNTHYYSTRDPFGRKGDFTTAPEITQIFGEIIGIWCINRWERAGKPAKCAIVELGPGRGTLMNDLLRGIRMVKDFAPEIHLVEISPVLTKMQQAKLKNHKVTWHTEIPELNLPTIVIANEFFDALPIKQFVGDKERMIIADGDNLAFNMPAEEGLVKEVCPQAEQIIAKLPKQTIAGALIDYGYTDNEAKIDTLQAMKKHEYTQVLENPGEVDLTAHVDFVALRKYLTKYSNKLGKIYSQKEFLLGHGADVRAKILNKEIDLERLIDPTQMGELFKVICF